MKKYIKNKQQDAEQAETQSVKAVAEVTKPAPKAPKADVLMHVLVTVKAAGGLTHEGENYALGARLKVTPDQAKILKQHNFI